MGKFPSRKEFRYKELGTSPPATIDFIRFHPKTPDGNELINRIISIDDTKFNVKNKEVALPNNIPCNTSEFPVMCIVD